MTLTKVELGPLTALGRRVAAWAVPLVPAGVTPNAVTAFGFAMLLAAGVAAYLASFDRLWLLVMAAGIFLHWVADEVDGALARARGLSSPRGFFLDLLFDAAGGAALSLGLGFASYAQPRLMMLVAAVFLMGVVLLLLQVHLRARFALPYIGPSEIQLGTVLVALLTFANDRAAVVTLGGYPLGWFDLGAAVLVPLCAGDMVLTAVSVYRALPPPGAA